MEKPSKLLKTIWNLHIRSSWVYAIMMVLWWLMGLRHGYLRNVIGPGFATELLGYVLVCIWLMAASLLISLAIRESELFERSAISFLEDENPPSAAFLGQKEAVLSPKSLALSIPAAATASALVVLVSPDGQVAWKAFTMGLCLMFAGIGYWGNLTVARTVKIFCETAQDKLLIYHKDRMAGLGFVRDYADTATLLVLSGLLVLPTAIRLMLQALALVATPATQVRGLFALFLWACSMLAWLIFSFLPAFRSRFILARTLRYFRHTGWLKMAKQRQAEHPDDAELRSIAIAEESLVELRAGLIHGVGTWKEFMVAAAHVVALVYVVAGNRELLGEIIKKLVSGD